MGVNIIVPYKQAAPTQSQKAKHSGHVIRAIRNLQTGHLNKDFDFTYKYWGKVRLFGSLS